MIPASRRSVRRSSEFDIFHRCVKVSSVSSFVHPDSRVGCFSSSVARIFRALICSVTPERIVSDTPGAKRDKSSPMALLVASNSI